MTRQQQVDLLEGSVRRSVLHSPKRLSGWLVKLSPRQGVRGRLGSLRVLTCM